jgi:hypothetical protein
LLKPFLKVRDDMRLEWEVGPFWVDRYLHLFLTD